MHGTVAEWSRVSAYPRQRRHTLITSAATQHAHYALECGHNLMIDAVRRKTVGNT